MTKPGFRDEPTEHLVHLGMSTKCALKKATLFETASSKLPPENTPFNGRRLGKLFVPGRLEFLGKHTDYAGGQTITCTIERGICAVTRTRGDRLIRLVDAGSGQASQFTIDPNLAPKQDHWSNYPMTVARRLARNFGEELKGADISFASDLPPAAGMSSSSALIILIYLVLAKANQLHTHPRYIQQIDGDEDLASYLATIENGRSFGTLQGDHGVGTLGGSEDHTAILCAQSGHLSRYSFCPVQLHQTINLPEQLVFVIASSGIHAQKTGAVRDRYNHASDLVNQIVDLWKTPGSQDSPTLGGLVATHGAKVIRDRLTQTSRPITGNQLLLDRFDQFVAENNEIIPQVAQLLARGELDAIGPLVDRSQQLADELLGNQIPQTTWLARAARQFGAIAASAFGAGFGGSVWALMDHTMAPRFCQKWHAAYTRQWPTESETSCFFLTRPGVAAHWLENSIDHIKL
ncbi:MAG: galactokinase [Phycisphaeraceae bacterium]|nr:galactokinase [Phycisphaeraceae bacterium]